MSELLIEGLLGHPQLLTASSVYGTKKAAKEQNRYVKHIFLPKVFIVTGKKYMYVYEMEINFSRSKLMVPNE